MPSSSSVCQTTLWCRRQSSWNSPQDSDRRFRQCGQGRNAFVDLAASDKASESHAPLTAAVIAPNARHALYSGMRFEKIWVEQCRATKAIKRRFGAKSALDYLIGEKLIAFADAAGEHRTFAKELPKFLAAIWQTFNEYEIAGYVASRKPATRHRLRQLLYLR